MLCATQLLILSLVGGAPAQAAAPSLPTLPASLAPEAGPGAAPTMQSAAALKAAVDRSQKAGRIGIITTYTGLGITVVGGFMVAVGAIRTTSAAVSEADTSEGSSTLVRGATVAGIGSLAALGGTATLGGSSLAGARHLQKLAPTHSAAAGWVSVGGLGAVAAGRVVAAAAAGSASTAGSRLSIVGFLTALVAGHVQHARNRRQSESLAALHPRKPGPLAPTLAYY